MTDVLLVTGGIVVVVVTLFLSLAIVLHPF